MGDGVILTEGGGAVRGLVAELPELYAERGGGAVAMAIGVIGVVGVGDPIGGLAGVAGAVAFGGIAIALLAVGEEVDAIEGLGAGAAAEVDELAGADAVGFLASPDVVAHGGAVADGADAFAPAVVAAE